MMCTSSPGATVAFNVIEELQELRVPMPRQALFNDNAREYVEGSEERRRAVADIVMSLCRGQSRPQRENRRGSLQRLDTALLVNVQNKRMFRGVHIEPDNITQL